MAPRSLYTCFLPLHRALKGSAGPAISYLSRGRGSPRMCFAVPGAHLVSITSCWQRRAPGPLACLSCEKDLEEPTAGFDCRNCRLIEETRGEVGGFSFRPFPLRAGNVLHLWGCSFHQRAPPPPPPRPRSLFLSLNMWPKLGTCRPLLRETCSRSARGKGICASHGLKIPN